MPMKEIDYEDVKLCNCAECGRPMLGRSMIGQPLPQCFDGHLWCGGYLDSRPYCEDCIKPRQRPVPPGRSGKDDDWSPSGENGVKAMEER
jgi:hypothetical protein